MKQVNGEKLLASFGDRMKDIRGRLTPDAPMDRVTWFRAGGLAELMFQPHDVDDLVAFLKALPEEVPLTILGVGSNVLVRDGGIPGVVGNVAPHLTKQDKERRVPEMHDLFIDIGVSSQRAAAELVRIGDPGEAGSLWGEEVVQRELSLGRRRGSEADRPAGGRGYP